MIKKFIRGNEERGAEVIKALEDLGGVNKNCKSGDFSSCIYYIDSNNSIECIGIESNFANIIKECFEEIQLSTLKVITNLDVAKWYCAMTREGHSIQFMNTYGCVYMAPWSYYEDNAKTEIVNVRIDFDKWIPIEEAIVITDKETSSDNFGKIIASLKLK